MIIKVSVTGLKFWHSGVRGKNGQQVLARQSMESYLNLAKPLPRRSSVQEETSWDVLTEILECQQSLTTYTVSDTNCAGPGLNFPQPEAINRSDSQSEWRTFVVLLPLALHFATSYSINKKSMTKHWYQPGILMINSFNPLTIYTIKMMMSLFQY